MENVKLKIDNELKPYDEYKETGLLWLDKVPKHWEIKSNKYLWAERKTANCIEEQLLSVTIKKGVISQTELLKSSSKKDSSNLDKSKYKLVMPNDIAYNKMRMWQGSVGVSNYRGIVSPAYIVLKSRRNINSRYYHLLLRTPIYIEESHRNSYGICDDQLSLRYEHFKCMQIIIPPKKEQDQIVRYLDSKLSKINKFINAKKKQIELLKELKQAIINQAVTKGLDPDVKMKPSGIEWLGDIPERWEVVKIKQLFSITNGATPKSGVKKYWDGSITWITPVDLNKTDVYVQSSERKITEEGFNSCSTKIIPKNNIVLATRAPIGNVRINDIDLCTNQGCKGLILKTADFIKYLFYSLRNYEKQLERLGDGTTFAELSNTKLSIFKIPLPPLQEQQQIVTYIENKTQTIDKSIEAIKKEISLITEYRTSLISSVVTGKVDVRHIEVEDVIDEIEEDFEDLEEENLDEEEIEMGEEE